MSIPWMLPASHRRFVPGRAFVGTSVPALERAGPPAGFAGAAPDGIMTGDDVLLDPHRATRRPPAARRPPADRRPDRAGPADPGLPRTADRAAPGVVHAAGGALAAGVPEGPGRRRDARGLPDPGAG